MAEKDQAPTAATPNPAPQAPAPTASAPLGTMVAPADGQPAAPQPGPNDPIPEADLALLNRAPKLRWGVIGCGVIANEMAASLALEGRRIAGVANRTRAKAEAYAARHGVEKVYDSYQQMYDDPDIDAIYVTTPHNTHIDFIRDAAAAGKHILCEKAITLNTAELDEGMRLAAENGVVLMDACTILHMPLYRELRRRLEAGDFGRVHMAQVNFGSFREYDEKVRFFNPQLAGGAMLDIGVYAFTMARTFLDSAPTEYLSLENPAFTGVDEESAIIMRNAERQLCTFSLTLHAKQPKRYVIATDRGYLEGMEYPRADEASFVWWPENRRETFRVGQRRLALNYALADLEAAVAGEPAALRCAEWSHDVMRMMTDVRYQWDFRYPEERNE